MQDGGAQLVDPDRQQAVVTGQAAELFGPPQGPVIVACAAGIGVGDIDEAYRGRVFEQHTQRVPAFDEVPGPRAGVAERSVVGVDDVQPPQRPQAPGRHQRRPLGAEDPEQLADARPRSGFQRGQGGGHRGAPDDRGGQRAGLTLPLDGLHPG